MEVNNHSLAPQRHKTVARDNNLEILRLCKKYEVPTILGSDAHISFQIADYERLYPLLAETEFPDELIMNYWPDKFFDYRLSGDSPIVPLFIDVCDFIENRVCVDYTPFCLAKGRNMRRFFERQRLVSQTKHKKFNTKLLLSDKNRN